ncbi:MAG: ferritin-like domain-containing protein [Planctomycetota bacterium]|nr:MAG: ferritin-like domain-containing protein [Planctomycetota bacterium]
MAFNNLLLRRNARRAWADPVRKVLTLESFSRTEDDGGKDILAAARRVQDSELRGHLLRHAEDEVRHADLFRRRAAELRADSDTGALAHDPGKSLDLSRHRPHEEVDAHGFFEASVMDERGQIPYVAMLHVAEQRAASLFAIHRDLTRDDPETSAIFEEILKDEKYHVAWTGGFLKKWRQEGHGAEVRRCLRASKRSRLMSRWINLGLRSGAGISHILLLLLYWTALVPFGLIARGRKLEPARPAIKAASTDPLQSQY